MMKCLETHKVFGGKLQIWEHESQTLKCRMQFSLFLPPQAEGDKVPVVTFLSGLTCTQDNFTTKSGAYKYAAEAGIALVAPDTSPRGEDVADEDAYDFGKGAGFYLNATQAPWVKHYHMEDYIAKELFQLVPKQFSEIDEQKQSLMGHSMGGHGALTLFFKYPKQYQSVSAFAPIVAPSQVPWGHKAFKGYLGSDQSLWKQHDACELVATSQQKEIEILIDQGGADSFLEEQLRPELFGMACQNAGQQVRIRHQEGYDHSYYFIQSFIEDHIKHHARYLKA